MTAGKDPWVAETQALFERMTMGDLSARAEVLARLAELQSLADGGDGDAQALVGGLSWNTCASPYTPAGTSRWPPSRGTRPEVEAWPSCCSTATNPTMSSRPSRC
jgi:hypothetical protein